MAEGLCPECDGAGVTCVSETSEEIKDALRPRCCGAGTRPGLFEPRQVAHETAAFIIRLGEGYWQASPSDRAAFWSELRQRSSYRDIVAKLVGVQFGGEVEFERASGDCVCPHCGKAYYGHKDDHTVLSYDGYPFLARLCDGTRVKL